VVREPTSASSQGSGGSTSPSNPTGSDASDRSNTSQLALPFSSDTGPESHGGEMSTSSPLLATPQAHDAAPGDPRRVGRFGTKHGGRNLNDDMALISSSAATPASPSPTPVSAAAPTTRATSGPSSPVLLASFDHDTRCWRTFQATLASELPKFSETLPRSGMTRSGRLYALPTLALPTDASGGSASPSLRTPTASLYEKGGSGGELRAGILHGPTRRLPTPRVSDANGTGQHGDGGPDLRSFIGDLTQPRSEGGNE
jgi:hypothetical protein